MCVIAHNFLFWYLQARQNHKRLRVVRIETTTDSQRIVGLFVPNAAVETVLQGLSQAQNENKNAYWTW